MRRNYISPEYLYVPVNGTYNTLLQPNIQGSILFNPDKNIGITNEDILYYQNVKGEQLNLEDEINTDPILFNTSVLKSNNSAIIQNVASNNANSWLLTIDYKKILFDYLFNILKKYRTFNGIKSDMTISNDIGVFINSYINNNIFPLYDFDHIDLYIKYVDLSVNNVYINNPIYDKNIIDPANLMNKVNLDFSNNILTATFSTTQDNTKFGFIYYFNLFFKY